MNKDFGYLRVGAATPVVMPAAFKSNSEQILELMKLADSSECDITVFPELSLTAYTCADLFRQQNLLSKALDSLVFLKNKSTSLNGLFITGFPMQESGMLFNCAAVFGRGRIYGIIPKTYIPNTNEYYENRWFSSGIQTSFKTVSIDGDAVPFGTDLLFRNRNRSSEIFSVEICEDLWAVIPPSSNAALEGALVFFNPSASTDLLGKAVYRKQLVKHQSAAAIGAYVYSSAGVGESTTDSVFGGHAIICENGKIVSENKRFSRENGLIYSDIDIEFLQYERMNNTSFSWNSRNRDNKIPFRTIWYEESRNNSERLVRNIDKEPFVPAGDDDLVERCSEILSIQSNGLATRLQNIKSDSVVIGLSGGLDSTLALLVVIEAFNLLSIDKKGIHTITMPGFGTSERTLNNVYELCSELGITLQEIDIKKACELHLHDIGHSIDARDVTYENTQARERTQILMNKANQLNALVVGTGDLSELALGWCTYNGDHMSMYSVNSGVPKTLVKFLIKYYADFIANDKTKKTLHDIIDTPISPELLPADSKGKITQKTEDFVGPYLLNDFFLFNAVRCGFPPEKVLFLAEMAFRDDYNKEEIRRWLKVFYRRFFTQQFKRSALPDGPKVGTISLSPRGDWRMPSDSSPEEWLTGLE